MGRRICSKLNFKVLTAIAISIVACTGSAVEMANAQAGPCAGKTADFRESAYQCQIMIVESGNKTTFDFDEIFSSKVPQWNVDHYPDTSSSFPLGYQSFAKYFSSLGAKINLQAYSNCSWRDKKPDPQSININLFSVGSDISPRFDLKWELQNTSLLGKEMSLGSLQIDVNTRAEISCKPR